MPFIICDFSYSHYRDTLQRAKKHYEFCTFKEADKKTELKYIILRHDVDFSLSKALDMARIDRNMNIKSTFFLQLHSPWYNIMSIEEYSLVKEILHFGREIGLHYDIDFYCRNGLNPTKTLIDEIKILEDTLGTEVSCVAPHLPVLSSSSFIPDSICNAGSHKFSTNIKYISDSAQSWREGCFCQVIGRYPRLQINIHPLWWGEDGVSRESVIQSITQNKVKEILNRKKCWLKFLENLSSKSIKNEEIIRMQSQFRPI